MNKAIDDFYKRERCNSLRLMNSQIKKLSPDDAFMFNNIEFASWEELDKLQDEVSIVLVNIQRKKKISMKTKQTKIQQWITNLENRVSLTTWTPKDTRSLRRTFSNTSGHASADDLLALQLACATCLSKPIRVDREHEVKAWSFWNKNCFTSSGKWRNNQFVRNLTYSQRELIAAYCTAKQIPCDLPNGTDTAFHSFADIKEIDESVSRYWRGKRMEVAPVWRLSVAGAGHFDYVYGSWQSGVELQILRTVVDNKG